MKRVFAALSALFFSLVAFAQETATAAADTTSTTIEIKINGEAMSGQGWWKATLVIVWTIICIILVLRTFRGKASV
ncbi:hypothetical protein [Marinoscillum sp.]|uniref:hypothetical protein n=1 Tax=Marinoscillum sp. TaxID=2024838 RepID=UPI003BAC34BB